MNKKLLGLAICGILAVTSLPSVRTLAATTGTTANTTQKIIIKEAYKYLGIAQVTSRKGVYAYSDADAGSDTIAYFQPGDTFKVYDYGDGWYAVSCPGDQWGYIRAAKVTLIHP